MRGKNWKEKERRRRREKEEEEWRNIEVSSARIGYDGFCDAKKLFVMIVINVRAEWQ